MADLQDRGLVSPAHTTVILDGLARVSKLIGLCPSPDDDPVGPDTLSRAEEDLCIQARLFDPRQLGMIADQIVEVLNPDGDPDRSEAHHQQRRLSLRRLSNQMWRIAGDLTPELGHELAVLRPLSRPRPADPINDSSGHSGGGADNRSPEQRLHDGLADATGRLLRAGGLPDTGGTPTTLIITVSDNALRTPTGTGTTSDGDRLPLRTVLSLADQAAVVPIVLDARGAVLWQGRSKRIATPAQTLALYARDGGCSFPGCDHPPEWCQRHHVISWADGGPTDIDNLTLLCSYHHHRFQAHGWTCTMIDGLPHWTAPPHHDPHQTPQLHHRIRAAVEQRAQPAAQHQHQDQDHRDRHRDRHHQDQLGVDMRPDPAPKFRIIPINCEELAADRAGLLTRLRQLSRPPP